MKVEVITGSVSVPREGGIEAQPHRMRQPLQKFAEAHPKAVIRHMNQVVQYHDQFPLMVPQYHIITTIFYDEED